MEKKNNKIHFYAEEYSFGEISWIRFIGQNGMKGYWAGGNEEKTKFILQQLTNTYGIDDGIKIYNAYNNALLAVSKDAQWNNKKAVLVFYEKVNDNQGDAELRTVWESKENVYGWKQGFDKKGKDVKKTTSSDETNQSIF